MPANEDPRIADYALIGDGRCAALISRGGAIDWLCWPRFDSPPIFGALLDRDRGGTFVVAPAGPARTSRRYLEDTNVVETTHTSDAGSIVVTDLAVIASQAEAARLLLPAHEVLRHVRCERGELEVVVHVAPRPDLGRGRARCRALGPLGIRWQVGARLISLRGEAPLVLGDDGVARATVRLRAGMTVSFSLTFDEDGPAVLPPLGAAVEERLARTVAWWRSWIARAHYDGPDRAAVRRSALVLKLMSFAPSGAIVAAPTTSLPELVGGDLNWDYRFCWLRDAAFTARALLGLGFVEEAEAFASWMLHATRLTQPELRVLYDVYGRVPGRERDRPELRGYRDSRPVRIGNAAVAQLQLDTYGELLDAHARIVRATGAVDGDTRRVLRDFGAYVAAHWRRPDQGIWEPRTEPRHHTHSRLLCWVALDRLLELDEGGGLALDRAALARQRAAIRSDIEDHAYDHVAGAYASELGGRELDASVLLMSWHGFHPAGSSRMRSTYARLVERLSPRPGLLYRAEDSLRSGEGAFWICSFWAVEHLARGGGTAAEARALFAAACAYASDLGLMSEEVDPRTGELIGNFPQAYTHVGLISAALTLAGQDRALAETLAPAARTAVTAEVRT